MRKLVLFAVSGVLFAACSPPAECPALLEVRDQDMKTLEAVAQLGSSSNDPKKSAENSKAYRDAAKKLEANAQKVDAMKPSDIGLAKYAKSYVAASKQLVLTLTGLGNQFEKLGYAQEKFAGAQTHVESARAKIASACKATPAPAGCSEIVATLAAAPVDEGARKQIIRDMESVKLAEALAPLRAETIQALKDMDAARKEIETVGIEPQATIATTTLQQVGGDFDKACGKKS